jgi:cobalt-zinc-cadmium efflux system membrane fusion protein
MRAHCEQGPILVVESDAVLGQVLSRVLAREDRTVVHAVNATQALQMAERHAPRLALLDCCSREGNGVELAAQLHARSARLPVIVMTDNAASGHQAPTPRGPVTRVLTKPVDLQDLRQVVDAELDDGETPLADAELDEGEKPTVTRPPRADLSADAKAAKLRRSRPAKLLALLQEFCMGVFQSTIFKVGGGVVLAVVLLAVVGMAVGAVPVPWQAKAADKAPPPIKVPALEGVELVPGQPHSLAVPEDVRKALGIRKGKTDLIVVAKKPTQTRPLVMPGSTALDPTRLYRIRARFAPSPSSAEVVQIAQVPEDPSQSGKTQTVFREIRSGDRVKKGDLLAVFESVDVGNKKNDLIDAIYQLELDEEILKKAEAHSESVPEVFILNARRNVQGDINTINRAVSTLKTWGIPEADIQAVRDEAEKVKKRQGKHDKEKDALWARVEMRAPDDGVIIERNVSLHEIIVDNTTNLFQIAKVDRLSVFANVPEDDLPALQALPSAQRRWTVRTVGSPPVPGFIDDISYLIDPNQHTAVVKGHIDNPHEVLRGGQFISATVELPPPPDVVEVPTDAVVEDGQQSVVFVQSDPKKHVYTMRRVELTQRFDKTVFVRSKPFAKNEQRTPEEEELGLLPKEPLHAGERILATGVGELKAALLDKEESQPNKDQNEGKSN